MSVFSDEWRACLREQYKYVIQQQDENTRQSLTHVLIYGADGRGIFTEDELAQLWVEATLRVEDNPADFVPDLDILQPPAASAMPAPAFQPHPLECQCPACVEMNTYPHDEEGQPITDEDALQAYIEEHAAQQDDDDAPKQLSMF